MKRVALILIGAVVVVVVGTVVWFYASTNIDDPVEVTAPPIATPESTTAGDTTASDTAASTVVADPGDPTTSTPSAATADGPTLYELADGSTVTFELDEVLNGSDKRVVATNPEVAAQLSVDPSDLSATQIGTVVVGAQTFETDSGNRNRAIRGPILDSTTFETIQFVPSSIEGLAGEAVEGETFEFTVTGDLTIRDVTNTVTFDVAASLVDGTTIQGTAESTVSRQDFGLEIPSVPQVADVSDAVLVRLDFVATAGV